MNDLQIEISGSDDFARAAVAAVVGEALVEQGFVNITQVGDTGEPVPAQDQATLMDIIRRERPDILSVPITISEFATASDDEEEADEAMITVLEIAEQ